MMHITRTRGLSLLCLAAATGCASHGRAPQSAPSPIVFRQSALLDMLWEVRREAQKGDVDPDLSDAVAAQREISSGGLREPPLDAFFLGSASARDALAHVDELPEFARGPGHPPFREPARRLLTAMAPAEAAFLQHRWPRDQARIAEAQKALEQTVLPRFGACLARLQIDLGVSVPAQLHVVLVADGPNLGGAFPVALTFFNVDGSMASAIPLGTTPFDQLAESLVHELTHQLDAPKAGNVLLDLRHRLADAGVDPHSRAMHDVPHTVMFVEAAEVVRRELFPQHQDYGSVDDCYYCKMGKVGEIVRRTWSSYLRGETTRDAALDEMVREIAAAEKS